MSTKSFLFICSWMQPLKNLPLQERWNVLEAVVEYATSGTITTSLSVMENIAFGFIRNEIDRMRQRRAEVCQRRLAAANARWGKEGRASKQTNTKEAKCELPDANACKCMQQDAPYHIESSESVSGSVSGSKSESEKKSSTTSSGARVKGTQAKIEALADKTGWENINSHEGALILYSDHRTGGCRKSRRAPPPFYPKEVEFRPTIHCPFVIHQFINLILRLDLQM